VDVHLVLTGPGGGTWDVAIGQGTDGQGASGQEAVSHESLAIVTDAVGFCRLAANRQNPTASVTIARLSWLTASWPDAPWPSVPWPIATSQVPPPGPVSTRCTS